MHCITYLQNGSRIGVDGGNVWSNGHYTKLAIGDTNCQLPPANPRESSTCPGEYG